MIPRYGRPPLSGQRYQRRPGVYAILPLGSDILLTHQSAPTPEFQLPGGGVDPGEAPLAALHREVREETGWTIAAPRLFGVFRRFTFMPEYQIWAEKLCTIYVARPVRKVTQDLEEGHLAIWSAQSAAAGLLGNSGDRAMLESYMEAGRPITALPSRWGRNTRAR